MGKKNLVLALVVLICVCVLAPAALAETVKLPSTMGGLNVRSGPGTDYEIAGWAKDGDKIEIVKAGSTWSKIRVTRSGKVGYINNGYIAKSTTTPEKPSKPSTSGTATAGRVTGRGVNLREGAGTGYKSVASLKLGTKLKIWETSGNWHYVTTLAGKSGWISKSYVKTGFTSTTTTSVNLRESANGKIIKTLLSGMKVDVESMTGGWSKVKIGKTGGYGFTTYLN